MPRLFVAIDIPPALCSVFNHMGQGLPGARAVPAGQIHLTLRFIGEVDGGMALDVHEALAEVTSEPFTLTACGIGHFPPRGTPRVLWVGIEPCPELVLLHNRVEQRLVRCGLAPEPRKFAPHITISRLKGCPLHRLGEFLAGNSLLRTDPFPVQEFILYSSRLIKSGAVHTVEQRYRLWRDRQAPLAPSAG